MIALPEVALLAHRLASPSATGIGRYYRELITALGSHGSDHALHYAAAAPREAEAAGWLPAGMPHRVIPGPRKLLALGWGAVGRPRIDAALGRPDLVHTLHPWAPTPTRAPLVVTIHDLMPVLHPEWHGRVESWLFGRGVAHARDHAAAIVTVSQFAADVLTVHGGIEPERVHVAWNGVGDEFRARPSAATVAEVCARHGVEPGRYLIAVGAVSARKNLQVVLRALARVDRTALGTPALLVAGPPGVGADAISALIDDLRLDPHVRLAGYVERAELPVLVGASRALVHPSRDEGFGIPPLEAMAAGVPTVVSDEGSLPEVTGGCALVVGADDVDGWAAAITQLATDDGEHAALVAAGATWQAQFTWSRTAALATAVHLEVLGRA